MIWQSFLWQTCFKNSVFSVLIKLLLSKTFQDMKICIFLALGTVNFFDLQQGKEISSLISKKHVIVSFSRNKMKSTLLALQSLLAHCKLNSFSFVYSLALLHATLFHYSFTLGNGVFLVPQNEIHLFTNTSLYK